MEPRDGSVADYIAGIQTNKWNVWFDVKKDSMTTSWFAEEAVLMFLARDQLAH